ncbi:hypothetical protein [Algibacter sp. 2305UL17-15]|uniref:hypothetical protein n=1 Tax=Algibacter sp. 2305UL17-15 TaxID=3231268 RepID=UPI003457C0F1
MKKSFLGLLLLVLCSCSTDNGGSDEPNGNSSGTLLKSFKKITSGALEFQINYEYDSKGNIVKSSQDYSYGKKDVITYSYDSNGDLTSFEQVTTDPFGDVTTEINNFNYQNGMVVKICQEITHPDGPSSFDYPEVDKIDFAYDSFGNVELFTHYFPEEAEFNDCDDVDSIDATESLEYDSNGNMIRYQNSEYFFTPTYLKYAYDNTNHPYASVKPKAFRSLLGFSTVNNISKAEEYNADTDELIGTVTFNYELNNQNYPTKLSRTYTAGSTSQSLVFEYSYY